ncbi:MAG: rRNA synthase [Chloroflexi bacterium]|nr:rRNA synthase [Chloroflexota bacterium]MDB5057369.1 rRNA synthase [Chloroflexota bacterium]
MEEFPKIRSRSYGEDPGTNVVHNARQGGYLRKPMPEIVYEDDDLVVVVKPHGMVTHPAHAHPDGTLWNQLVDLFAARGLPDHPRLLHRLDRDTSGLICVPKLPAAHRSLERALRAGRFEKRYLALATGRMEDAGTIEAPLGRDLLDRRRVCVRKDGQHARTHFRAIRRFHDYTLLRISLDTGRTHQIRVHLAHVGHPLAGDTVYGDARPVCERLFLHADCLAFPHPAGKEMVRCLAPLPADLKLALCRLAVSEREAGERSNCSCAAYH